MPNQKWSVEWYDERFKHPYNEVGWKRGNEVRVRVVGTDLEFPSIAACARHFRVSAQTVTKWLDSGEKQGDIQLERVEE